MLEEYSNRLDNVLLRHETRYDILTEFNSAHLTMIQNFKSVSASQSAAKTKAADYMYNARLFVKDRCIYKRDYMECFMCMLCTAQLIMGSTHEGEQPSSHVLSNAQGSTSPAAKGKLSGVLVTSSSGASKSNGEMRPELLAANICLRKGLTLKRKLREHVSGYNRFVESLDKLMDDLATANESIGNTVDSSNTRVDAIYLPLHDYGTYSQESTSSSSNCNNKTHHNNKAKESLMSMTNVEQTRLDNLVEVHLAKRLKRSVEQDLTAQRELEKVVIPRVLKMVEGVGKMRLQQNRV
jgi:hypothetical protein